MKEGNPTLDHIWKVNSLPIENVSEKKSNAKEIWENLTEEGKRLELVVKAELQKRHEQTKELDYLKKNIESAAKYKVKELKVQEQTLSQEGQRLQKLVNTIREHRAQDKDGDFLDKLFSQGAEKVTELVNKISEKADNSIQKTVETVSNEATKQFDNRFTREKKVSYMDPSIPTETRPKEIPKDGPKKREFVNTKILDKIQKSSLTLGEIAESIKDETGFSASLGKVRLLAKEKLTPEDYHKRFPAAQDKHSESINSAIFNEILKSNLNLKEIAEKMSTETGIEVSKSKVVIFAKEKLTPEEYHARFPINKHPESIDSIIIDKVLNSSLSLRKIAESVSIETGIEVSYPTVKEIALEKLKADDYQKRFPAIKDRHPESVNDLILDKILNSDSSIIKIVKQVSMETGITVSNTKITNIAKKRLSNDEYQKRFPASQEKHPESVDTAIINEVLNSNLTLQGIAEKITLETGIEVSSSKVVLLAKKKLPLEDYQNRFPPTNKFPKLVDDAIIDKIQNSNLPIDRIGDIVTDETGVYVSRTKVTNVAKGKLSPEEYQNRFPASKDRHPESIETIILDKILKSNLTLDQIAEEITKKTGVGIGHTKISKVAKEKLNEEEYQKRFPASRDKYPEYLEIAIEDKILKSNLSLKEIAEELTNETGNEVKPSKIANIAKDTLTPEEYQIRFPIWYYQMIGDVAHSFLEKLFSESMQNKGITILNEPLINEQEKKRVDNLIIIDERFKNIFKDQFPPNIKYISIDYSLDTTQKNFEVKCHKNYHSEDTIFYFIPITHNKKIDNYEIPQVPFKENIKILPIREFAKFFKLDDEHGELLIKQINWLFKVKTMKKEEGIKLLIDFFESLTLNDIKQKLITEFK